MLSITNTTLYTKSQRLICLGQNNELMKVLYKYSTNKNQIYILCKVCYINTFYLYLFFCFMTVISLCLVSLNSAKIVQFY